MANDIKNEIEKIEGEFEIDLAEAISKDTLDVLYLRYFSKTNGVITMLMKQLPELSIDDRKVYGPKLNEFQQQLRQRIENAKKENEILKRSDPLIDLTLPKKPRNIGYMHPTNQVIGEMNDFFRYLGYSVVEGPEIETAEYNFLKLNLPEGHPATDLQDTLFISEPNICLRTHTSSIESRILTDYEPPIRVVAPGKCFRNETYNATNAAFFYQYQGFVVDKDITIQNLMDTIEKFHKSLYGQDTEVRFRYKYYPEVSPGLGADMKCKFCEGKGCVVCKHRGWIEVLGSGMIHYNTLKMCGIDPEEYTGFAFGMGLDRLVMQKFGIEDIRHLYGGGIVYE